MSHTLNNTFADAARKIRPYIPTDTPISFFVTLNQYDVASNIHLTYTVEIGKEYGSSAGQFLKLKGGDFDQLVEGIISAFRPVQDITPPASIPPLLAAPVPEYADFNPVDDEPEAS